MKRHKNLIAIIVFSLATTIAMASLWFLTFSLVSSHWQLMLTPCVECVKSFSRHFFTLSYHLFPLLLFAFSSLAFLRGGLFLIREYRFQKSLLAATSSQDSKLRFIADTPLSAWSSGFIFPSIHINEVFWKSLTPSEKKALTAHETCHVEERHMLQFLLLGWVKALLPLPYVSRGITNLIEHIRLRSEFEADNHAIAASSRQTLASLLYKALQFESVPKAHAMAGVDSFLYKRVRHLTSDEHHPSSAESPVLLRPVMMSLIFSGILISAGSIIEPLKSCL